MDRMEEYSALMDEFREAPPALDGTVARAQARYKKRKTGRAWGIPLASLGGVAAAFVLLVNTSVPFARACGGVPLLRDLAAAVALSPSLKAAVEHDYVQPMGLTQTAGGVTMTVEYLIVDQKQVNIFYALESGEYSSLWGDPEVRQPDGGRFAPCAVSTGPADEATGLFRITADFLDQDTPAALQLLFKVRGGQSQGDAPVMDSGASEDEPGYVAEFAFDLRFDPAFTETGVTYALNQTLELDGQQITVTDVEVYPTHVRLNLADAPGNTAWLKSLDFYLTDERGNRYEKISNGISASGGTDSPFMASHRLESSYFGDAAHLTVHITGAVWLDKDTQYATVDVAGGTAENLPQGVTLGGAARRGEDVRLTLFAPVGGGGSGLPMGTDTYSVSDWSYRDPEGVERRFDSMSTTGGFRVDGELDTPDGVPAGCFSETFTLPDYPFDTVELGMSFSRWTVFPRSVDIPIS